MMDKAVISLLRTEKMYEIYYIKEARLQGSLIILFPMTFIREIANNGIGKYTALNTRILTILKDQFFIITGGPMDLTR